MKTNAIDRFADKPVVLDVRNLEVNFVVHGGRVYAVRDVSFQVRRGECYCIVGESGSGKSVTMQGVMGILPMPPAQITRGTAHLGSINLIGLPARERQQVLGKEIAMIFQDPLTSLNPTMTAGTQIGEMLILHTNLSREQRKRRVIELLEVVRIPEPQKRYDQYPHELSGGMRQRIMIAMALACNPQVLVADEPTTALDVTIQDQILALIRDLAVQFDMATILITHDLGVVARMADRVAVMYAGKIVEEGLVNQIFYDPKHPYNLGLKRAMPQESSLEPLIAIPGTPPDLFSPPAGCAFAPRCPNALEICHVRQPPETQCGNTRVSCWLHHEYAANLRTQAGVSTLQEDC